jgi:hypothetical protein
MKLSTCSHHWHLRGPLVEHMQEALHVTGWTMFQVKREKSHLESLSLLLWTQAGLHFNTEFLRTVRQLETNVVSIPAECKNDKLLRRQFVYLLILNIDHPFTQIATLCMCSPWGPQWCQFRHSCSALSPLFWQNTHMNTLLKAQWKCTMQKATIKIYLYIYLEFSKNSHYFCLRVYFDTLEYLCKTLQLELENKFRNLLHLSNNSSKFWIKEVVNEALILR